MRSGLMAVFVASTTLLAAQAAAQSEHASYTFLRNGAPVGRHTVDMNLQGSRRMVSVATQVAVQVTGGITLFRYSHRGSELWDGQRLLGMETRTEDDGRTYGVTVMGAGASMVVRSTTPGPEDTDKTVGFSLGSSGKSQELVVPGGILPTSWWNRRVLEQKQLLNTQFGTVGDVTVQTVGPDTVRIGGVDVAATRYRLGGAVPKDIWYDDRGRWLKSRFRGRDGSTVEVVRDRF